MVVGSDEERRAGGCEARWKFPLSGAGVGCPEEAVEILERMKTLGVLLRTQREYACVPKYGQRILHDAQ